MGASGHHALNRLEGETVARVARKESSLEAHPVYVAWGWAACQALFFLETRSVSGLLIWKGVSAGQTHSGSSS